MYKIYLNIEGMMCSMCEAHINNEIRKAAKVKKVKSSHKKNEAIIVMDNKDNIESIINSIKAIGYGCSLNKIEEI